ncbi:MAG: hypothetical protein ACM3YE_00425 [Bacteroidota bacterium]
MPAGLALAPKYKSRSEERLSLDKENVKFPEDKLQFQPSSKFLSITKATYLKDLLDYLLADSVLVLGFRVKPTN